MSTPKTIKLECSEGVILEVVEAVALESQTIKHMMEVDCVNSSIIPLPNVTSKILTKVFECCKSLAGKSEALTNPTADLEFKTFQSTFRMLDEGIIYDLLMAAKYLKIKSLLDICCETVADNLIGKTPEEFRKLFNIKNDYTPEEEEEVKKEHAWVFDVTFSKKRNIWELY